MSNHNFITIFDYFMLTIIIIILEQQKIISYGMLNFLQNTQLIQDACRQFLEPHPCLYSFQHQIKQQLLLFPHLKLEYHTIQSQSYQSNKIIQNNSKLNILKNTKNSQTCIIYLHGLSSYCLQGKFLIPLLGDSLSLCLYDLRAHGKNDSKFVTYGLLESQNLYQIIKLLIRNGFKNIVLWGRSLGAATILRTIQQYSCCEEFKHVKYAIADAPFCSFKTIASELITRFISLPSFITGLVADAFIKKIEQKHGINLKELNFEGLDSKVYICFLHSCRDELMDSSHLQRILSNYKGHRQIYDTEVPHNQRRPQWVISKLIENINLKCKKDTKIQQKRRGLSIIKFSSKYLTVVTPTSNQVVKKKITNKSQQTMRNLVKSYVYEQNQYQIFSQHSQVLESSYLKENSALLVNSQKRNIHQLKKSKIRTITSLKDVDFKKKKNFSSMLL